uniref:Uncharacterized protein n=1 Tax=Anguilla anguilla TaxID=7936 RepID=A0A0E9SHT4_ANGAN
MVIEVNEHKVLGLHIKFSI